MCFYCLHLVYCPIPPHLPLLFFGSIPPRIAPIRGAALGGGAGRASVRDIEGRVARVDGCSAAEGRGILHQIRPVQEADSGDALQGESTHLTSGCQTM